MKQPKLQIQGEAMQNADSVLGSINIEMQQEPTNTPPNKSVKARPSAAGTSRKRAAPYLHR